VRIADTMLAFTDLCHSCGGCMEVCPVGAITETGRELGVIEKGVKNRIEFIHGRLRIGEAMSPPLIKKVRKMAGNEGLTIIDAPPGTSCPVISAMKNTDFVILVTEPTPFGLHDLKLAAGAVKILGIPCGIIINRSDMGDDRVKGFAADEGIPILMEIPFDRRVAESYSRGELIVEYLPEYRKKFCDLYVHIKDIVASGVNN
jgi:MinD superfamily P-loop ATPase